MKTLPISEVRDNLPKLVDEVDQTFERIFVTKSGKTKAVLMSSDEFESWQETIDVLSDRNTMAVLLESKTDIESGQVVSHEDLMRKYDLD